MLNPSEISSELRLLMLCGLGSDAELVERIGQVADSFDWERFGLLAEAHDMAGLVFARTARLVPGRVPAAVSNALGAAYRGNAVVNLAQLNLSVQLSACLAAAKVPSLILKGAALGQLLYAPDADWRNSTDVDILVAPEDLARAASALEHHGLQRRNYPASAAGQGMLHRLDNAEDFVEPLSGMVIELHHRPCRNPHWISASFAQLHSSSIEIGTPAGRFRSLGGSWLVNYLCRHALAHHGYRLKWFCDIARALRVQRAASCTTLCEEQAADGDAHLALADLLLALLAPDEWAGPGQVQALRWQRQAARILDNLERPFNIPTARSLTGLPSEIGYRLFLARLSPNWRGKAYELADLTCDPRDAEVMRLDPRFLPLYVLVGPILAAWRLLTRGKVAGRAIAASARVG